jgi:branched-chain amino acid transport system ATP-binding protein
MVQADIARVPEGRRLFAGMTVRENLLMGAYLRGAATAKVHRDLDLVLTTFPRLGERTGQDASALSGGEQQMCAIGRGLMSGPRLLMLDELSLWLAPKIVGELVETLRGINRLGMSILVVEQDVAIALQLATRGFVIDTGRSVAADKTSTLATSAAIRRAYLGDAFDLAF